MEVRNEFARVSVELDAAGNGPRLKLRDLKTGHEAFFDALELESLAWSSRAQRTPFLDPSLGRWRDPELRGLESLLRDVRLSEEG